MPRLIISNGGPVTGSESTTMLQGSLYVIVFMLMITACNDINDCFHGTGNTATEFREAGAFKSIELSGNINLRFRQDSTAALKVTAGENLLDGIETRIENNTLFISNKNRCNWVRKFNTPITVEVASTELNLLFIRDATGDVKFEDTLRVKDFRLDSFSGLGTYDLLLDVESAVLAIHTGPSDLKVAGRAGYVINYQLGYGKNDCERLLTDYTIAVNKGTNDLRVNAGNRLDVKLEGTGDIYYAGDPVELNKQVSGKGKLIKL